MSQKEQDDFSPTFRRPSAEPQGKAEGNADMAVYFAYHAAKRRLAQHEQQGGGLYEDVKRMGDYSDSWE